MMWSVTYVHALLLLVLLVYVGHAVLEVRRQPMATGNRSRPLADKLWEKVAIKTPAECWEFTGSKNEHGYGSVWHEGKHIKAHRAAWLVSKGEIPEYAIRHKCDNPSCCNPNHLEPGTLKQNSRDMVERGRHKPYFGSHIRGEAHPSTKISDATKEAIRKDPRSHRKIAAAYGISKTHVTRIKADTIDGNW